MENRKKDAPGQQQAVQEFPVWTFEQAGRALPFVQSVMTSIRELFLNLQGGRRRTKILDGAPGRPTRRMILEQEELKRDVEQLETQLGEAVGELAQLNIHCVDPVNGIAMIPFVNAHQLAWFVFDLFGDEKMNAWRYHHDPLHLRRPLPEREENALPAALIV
jgi:hypothetical protein